MSLITRTYTFTDGTTAYGSQLESEVGNIVNTLNSLDAGSSTWSYLKATTLIQAPNGAVGAPSINLGDTTTGFYRSASNVVSVALAGVLAASFASTGTADDTAYNPLNVRGGTSNNSFGITKYTTTGVVNSAKQIGRVNNDAGIVIVVGNDGAGNQFVDLLISFDATVTAPTVVNKSEVGSPGARTYTSASGQVKVAIASGTSTVSSCTLGLNFR